MRRPALRQTTLSSLPFALCDALSVPSVVNCCLFTRSPFKGRIRDATGSNPRAGTERRSRLAQHGQTTVAGGVEGQSCVAGLLDLRLHQLHAHHSRFEETRKEVSERAGCDRGALSEVCE